MRVVAAHAYAFTVAFQRGAGGSGLAVVKADMAMYVVTDRLHPAPAHRRIAKLVPGKLQQCAVYFAVAAGQQKLQRFWGQVGGVMLPGRPVHIVRQAGVAYDRLAVKPHLADASKRIDAPALVAKSVAVFVYQQAGLNVDELWGHKVGAP